MIRLAAVLVVALVAWPQAVTFRSDVNLLSVQVRVTHYHRPHRVRGLERDAFQLEENGIRQPIAFLQEQETLSLGILMDASSSMSGSRKFQQAKSALPC